MHISSLTFDEPLAIELLSKSTIVVAIHGQEDESDEYVMPGGLDTQLCDEIAQRLSAADFAIRQPPAHLKGTDPSNVCNRCVGGKGVQIEISMKLRRKLATSSSRLAAFADAVRTPILGTLAKRSVVGKLCLVDRGDNDRQYTQHDVGERQLSVRDWREHFGHLPETAPRLIDSVLAAKYIGVPASSLRCMYPRLGGGDSPDLMSAIGNPSRDLTGVPFVEIAEQLRIALDSGQADSCSRSVRNIQHFMTLGIEAIYALPQTMLLLPTTKCVFVREGNHRCIALLLIGAADIVGVDLSDLVAREAGGNADGQEQPQQVRQAGSGGGIT
jgi:hypothetical protein